MPDKILGFLLCIEALSLKSEMTRCDFSSFFFSYLRATHLFSPSFDTQRVGEDDVPTLQKKKKKLLETVNPWRQNGGY